MYFAYHKFPAEGSKMSLREVQVLDEHLIGNCVQLSSKDFDEELTSPAFLCMDKAKESNERYWTWTLARAGSQHLS